ncbi:HEPN domain-containing protein [Streptomyces sp. NPDC056485]|uniref:ApeA N-terminal domain 1-containing protein n=1 Tax=Streptomyces sp. NPDC056485 TaxID=3345834 RepID=UPI0036A15177
MTYRQNEVMGLIGVDSFESDGLFWLPEDKENQIAGRISFDPSKGARLSLIGSFSEFNFEEELDSRLSRGVIHGVAGKKFLTLIDCRLSSRKTESPGFAREDYRAESLFAGQALITPGELRFDRVRIKFNNLFTWTSRTLVSREYEFDNSSKKLSKATLTLEPVEAEEVSAEICSLGLIGTWKISSDPQNPGYRQDFSLSLNYSQEVDFSEIKGDISSLQDLITAMTDSVTVPTEVALWVPGNNPESRLQINFYGQQVASGAARAPKPGDTFLDLEQIGGVPAMARWLDFTRSRRILLGLSLSSKYRQLYVENKFFNAVSAAETLHRMEFPNEMRPADEYKNFRKMLVRFVPKNYRGWLSQQLAYSNEPRLRQRLYELAEFSQLSTVLGCDSRAWVAAVTETRNRMVHHDKGKASAAAPADFHWMAESLHVMVLLCLMRFCEFKEGYIETLKQNSSVDFLGENVREILART